MAAWGHSAFLQALGWATLNSFWQMGLLWCLFSVANPVFRLSSAKKYNLAVTTIMGGFGWFMFTLFSFSTTSGLYQFSFTPAAVAHPFISNLITAASITYLCLLFIPAYRLLKNWQHVQKLRTQHLYKADLACRLFVKKIAFQLGIKRKVQVYLSHLIKSPITIGYVKPVILLPIAVMNNLSLQQVEAVLLHELSHIKRYDYLINVIVTIIHTLLYFNPFVKLFIQVMEAERENCCDEIVLQFEYDKIGYASALLTLEKNARALMMAAAGKKHLLNRIEKIVGMERKPVSKMNQAIGIFATFLFVCLLNVVLFAGKKEKNRNTDLAFTQLANPFYFLSPDGPSNEDVQLKSEKAKSMQQVAKVEIKASKTEKVEKTNTPTSSAIAAAAVDATPVEVPDVVPVSYNLADAALDNNQKEQVKKTVKATKKILSTYEWKEVENEIADGMTVEEKQVARQQYLNEMEKINWNQLEKNLKAEYHKIDWEIINNKINNALISIKLDSLQEVYSKMMEQAAKAKADSQCVLAYPDVTVEQLNKIRNEAEKRVEVIKAIRNKKIVHL